MIPSPPEDLIRFTVWFFAHMIEPTFCVLAVVSFSTWLVLMTQRQPGESAPARWLRRLTFAKFLLWTSAAVGRFLGEWASTATMTTTLSTLCVAIVFLSTLVSTYLLPILRGNVPPPVEGEVLPVKDGWDGVTERRRGERRRGWPPPKVGA